VAGSPGAKVVGRLALKVLPDTSDFVPKLKAFAERVERSVKIEIPVEIDSKRALAQIALLRGLASKKVDLLVDVDRNGAAAKQVVSLSKQLGGLSSRLPPLISSGGQFSILLRRWGALLTIVSTLLLALGPSLAVLVPLTGGLVLGGLAVFAAWDRVSKLFATLKPQWEALTKVVGAEMVKGLEPLVALLGQRFFPVLQDGLAKMAGVLNRSFAFLARWLTSAPGIATIGKAFDAIALAMEPFGQLLTPLVRLFAELAIAAAPGLKLIGDALVTATNKFASFLATGKATDTITQSVKDIGNILSIIGSVASAVFPAVFAGAKLVISAVQAIIESASAFGPAFKGLGGLFDAILPTVQAIWAALQPVIQALGAKLAAGFATITPIVKEIGALFQQLLPILVPVIQFISTTLLGAVIGAITGILTIVKGALGIIVGIINVFKGVLTGNWSLAWSGLVGILTGVWNVIKGIILVAWNVGVIGVIRKGFTIIKTLFTSSFGAIVSGVKSFGNGIVSLFKSAFSAIGSIVKGGWNAIKSMFSAAWAALKTAVSTGLKAIGTLIKTGITGWIALFTGAAKLLFKAGVALINGLIGGIKSVFGKVKSTLKSLTDSLPKWKGPPSRDASILYGSGRLVISGFLDGLESQYGAVQRSLGGFTDSLGSNASLTASLQGNGPLASNLGVLDSSLARSSSARPSEGDTYEIHPAEGMDEVELARLVADQVAWNNR
jgi:phage-related protein